VWWARNDLVESAVDPDEAAPTRMLASGLPLERDRARGRAGGLVRCGLIVAWNHAPPASMKLRARSTRIATRWLFPYQRIVRHREFGVTWHRRTGSFAVSLGSYALAR
jgi:hypothetical protein